MGTDLLDRIAAALAAGVATSTEDLSGLLLAASGEKCWQRPRLLHRLQLILESKRPRMASATTYRFKPAFAGKDFSGFPLVVGDKTKIITAHNLTDEDVELMQRHGGAHLLEPISGDAPAPADSQTNDESEQDVLGLPAGFDYEKLVSDVADLVLSRIQADTVADLTTDEVRTTNSATLQTAIEQTADSTVVKHSSGGPDDLPITAPAAMQAQVVTPTAIDPVQAEPEDLHKLLKPALQARYAQVLGHPAPDAMLKEDLIKAIEAGPKQA